LIRAGSANDSIAGAGPAAIVAVFADIGAISQPAGPDPPAHDLTLGEPQPGSASRPIGVPTITPNTKSLKHPRDGALFDEVLSVHSLRRRNRGSSRTGKVRATNHSSGRELSIWEAPALRGGVVSGA
jgi:hypothetical protein